MADDFASNAVGMDSPAQRAALITPDDSALLNNSTRAIYVGGAGNLRVEMVGGDIVTLVGVVAGYPYPLRVQRVFSTGTTATNLVGLR